MVPTAVEAKDTLSGFARAASTMSRADLYGGSGRTISAIWFSNVWQIGSKDFFAVADIALHQRQHRLHQRRDEHQRMAIGCGAGHVSHADRAARAGAVRDHERLLITVTPYQLHN